MYQLMCEVLDRLWEILWGDAEERVSQIEEWLRNRMS